jgi:hypothetical protein
MFFLLQHMFAWVFNSPAKKSMLAASAPISLTRSQLDEIPIHIIHAYCSSYGKVDQAENGLTVVRSILMARENGASSNRRYVFHIVTDEITGRAMREVRNATRAWKPEEYEDYFTFKRKWGDVFRYIDGTGGRVEVRHYYWQDLDAALLRTLGAAAEVGGGASVPHYPRPHNTHTYARTNTLALRSSIIRGSKRARLLG